LTTTSHYGPQDFHLIGKRTASKEAPRHVRGHGQYVDDLQLPGMLRAVTDAVHLVERVMLPPMLKDLLLQLMEVHPAADRLPEQDAAGLRTP
jgi:hypothetical protein